MNVDEVIFLTEYWNSFDNKINKTCFRLECNVSYVLSPGLSSRCVVGTMRGSVWLLTKNVPLILKVREVILFS
jgi:hypothetical protein